jgi:hypothetical protein
MTFDLSVILGLAFRALFKAFDFVFRTFDAGMLPLRQSHPQFL